MVASSGYDIIDIPLGTRLQRIVLKDGEVHVWIAIRFAPPAHYDQWQGTYLRIEPNGRVMRITVDDNNVLDDEFIIKDADK